MKRILISSDPVAFKISKPGFDVETADDDDMLMSLTNIPAQVVMAGRIFCEDGVGEVVPFPFPLPSAPAVDFQSGVGSTSNLLPFQKTDSLHVRIEAVVTTTQMTITCENFDRWVNYTVIARSPG